MRLDDEGHTGAVAYPKLIAELSIGKRLPDGVYVHASTLSSLPQAYAELVDRAAAIAAVPDGTFNVVKFATARPKVSLLRYENFFEDGFPELRQSWAVDLATRSARLTSYLGEANPPILHRKETLLSDDHPLQREFRALTKAAEDAGLFENAREIGQKRPWLARLARVQLAVDGNRLIDRDDGPDEAVHRHRTAMVRYSLSAPMQLLWRHSYLDGSHTVFDYGCGRGDDIRALQQRGLHVGGWDPHFAPDSPRLESDVVNLGFVLNVIEDVQQRREALLGAWALTRQVLSIAVMLAGKSAYDRFRLYRDGVITNRGTFQKFYTQAELREYVAEIVGREPVAVGPGVLLVFKDDEEEQRFLAKRQMSWGPSSPLPRVPATPRPQAVRVRKASKWEVHRELYEDFWQQCLSLGRAPEADEFSRSAEVRSYLGTTKAVLARCIEEFGDTALAEGRDRRRADRLVYLALNIFEARRSIASLPEPVRRDVRVFWGSFAAADAEARSLLYSAGKPNVLLAAAKEAANRGHGFLEGEEAFHAHGSVVMHLPSVMRVYLACAGRVYGELDSADLIKIHIGSNKLSLMTYDDFEGRAVPMLLERVKITLGRADFQVFEYTGDFEPQPLYLKSRYVPADFPLRDAQARFDKQLDSLALFDFSKYGPSASAFREALANAGLAVRGFRLIRRKLNQPPSS